MFSLSKIIQIYLYSVTLKMIFFFISKICMVKILYPEYILITANYCFKSLHCLIKIVNVKDQISECSSSDLYLSLARTVGRIHIIFLASCIFEQRTLADYKPWRYGTLSMTRALYVIAFVISCVSEKFTLCSPKKIL